MACDMDEILVPAWSNEHNRGLIGGLYIRPFGPVAKGYQHKGHRHYIQHAMFVEAGSVRVHWRGTDGREGVLVVHAPNFINVKAEAYHQITALEDGTRWRCIFSEKEAEGLLDDGGQVPFNMERADG